MACPTRAVTVVCTLVALVAGDALHVDAMFNQSFSETFALGLHGYYYKQFGSSGSN